MNAIKRYLKHAAMIIVGTAVIFVWCITHPRAVWAQAKKELFGHD